MSTHRRIGRRKIGLARRDRQRLAYWRVLEAVDGLAALEAFCPERHVGADYPPTLLAHGTADTDVPYKCSVDMAAALARAGVSHQLLTIPDGRHGFDGPIEMADVDAPAPTPEALALPRTVAFLCEHFGQRAAGGD